MIWMIDIKTSKDGVNNGNDGNFMVWDNDINGNQMPSIKKLMK